MTLDVGTMFGNDRPLVPMSASNVACLRNALRPYPEQMAAAGRPVNWTCRVVIE